MKHLIALSILSSILFSDLINPQNNSDLNYIHILFEWDQEPDATSYNLQASNQLSFNNVLVDIEELTTSYIDTSHFYWDSTIHWKVRPVYVDGFGEWSEVYSFSIREKQFPEIDADIYNADLLQDGLVAFGGFAPELSSVVIDEYGNEIWNAKNFIINHINQYGNIYGLSGYDHPNNTGTKINCDGDFIWSAPTTDPLYAVDIHEFKQIPNGNYMGFVPDYMYGPIPNGSWSFYYQAVGYQVDGITNEYPWIGMRIVEWDKYGNEVWNWDPFEHFSMDDHDLYGGIWWDFQAGSHDWMHSNAFHFDEEESVIYVSHRHLSRISKIAYPSGNVIWNMGMLDEYNTGSDNICTDLGFSFQHHIQFSDDRFLMTQSL